MSKRNVPGVLGAVSCAAAMAAFASSCADAAPGAETQQAPSALTFDCSDPVDEPCPDAGLASAANVYALTGLDGTTLTGINKFGSGLSAELVAETQYKLADLSHWSPNPIRPLAAAYNEAVQSGEGVLEAVQAYAAAGGYAHVAYPPEPVFPPNPISPKRVLAFRPVALF